MMKSKPKNPSRQANSQTDAAARNSFLAKDRLSHGPIIITDSGSVQFAFSNVHYRKVEETGNKHTGADLAIIGVGVANLENVEILSFPLAPDQRYRVTTLCDVGGSMIGFEVKGSDPVEIDFDSAFMLLEDQDPSCDSDPRKIFHNREAKLAELLVTDMSDNELLRVNLRSFPAMVGILELHLD